MHLYLGAARKTLHGDVLNEHDEEEGQGGRAGGRGGAAGGRGRGRGGRAGRGRRPAPVDGEEGEEEDEFEPVVLGVEGVIAGMFGTRNNREIEAADPREFVFLSVPRIGRDGAPVTTSRVLAGQCNLMSQEVVKAAKKSLKKDGLG